MKGVISEYLKKISNDLEVPVDFYQTSPTTASEFLTITHMLCPKDKIKITVDIRHFASLGPKTTDVYECSIDKYVQNSDLAHLRKIVSVLAFKGY
jgi:hypothetical protein